MPNATPRVLYVATITRNDVNMQMKHRLPRRRPRIDPNVITVGRVALLNNLLGRGNRLGQSPLLLRRGVEPGGHHATRHQKRVAWGDGEGVPEA